MKDLWRVLARIRALEEARKPYVLATVVAVEGSAYRGPGTRMLVTEEGECLGVISGGCLEQDVREQSMQVLATGRPRVIGYDSRSEEDILWGTGLGCAGQVRVLLERFPDETKLNFQSFLLDSMVGRKFGVLATIFGGEDGAGIRMGQRLMCTGLEASHDDLCNGELRTAILDDVLDLYQTVSKSTRPTVEGTTKSYAIGSTRVDVLLEGLCPPISLLVFGAGYDAQPIVRLASEMGWPVSVVDHRGVLANPDRFPDAHLVLAAQPEDVDLDSLIDRRTVAVLMTHSYLQDLKILKSLWPYPLAYLGLLGPSKRSQRLLKDLEKDGFPLIDGRAERLFGPIGLDIGAESAEEIALSVLGEIHAVLTGRTGGFIRERKAPIHDRN